MRARFLKLKRLSSLAQSLPFQPDLGVRHLIKKSTVKLFTINSQIKYIMLNQLNMKGLLVSGILMLSSHLPLIGNEDKVATATQDPAELSHADPAKPSHANPAKKSVFNTQSLASQKKLWRQSAPIKPGAIQESTTQTKKHYRTSLTQQDQSKYLKLGRIFTAISQFAAIAGEGEEGLRRALAMPMDGFDKGYVHNFRRGLSWPTRTVSGELDAEQDQVVFVEGRIRAIIRSFAYTHALRKKIKEGVERVHGQEPKPADVDWYLDDELKRGLAKMEVYLVLMDDQVEVIRTLWEHGPVYGPMLEKTAAQNDPEKALGLDQIEEDLDWHPPIEWVDYQREEVKRTIDGSEMQLNAKSNWTVPLTKVVVFRRPNDTLYEESSNHSVELIVVIMNTRHELTQDDRNRDSAFGGRYTHGRTLETVRYDYIDPNDGSRIEWETRENQERPHQIRNINYGWQWYYIDGTNQERIVSQVTSVVSHRTETYVEMVQHAHTIPGKTIGPMDAGDWGRISYEDRMRMYKQNCTGGDWGVRSNGDIWFHSHRRGGVHRLKGKRRNPCIHVRLHAETTYNQVPTQRQRTVSQITRAVSCTVDPSKNCSWTQ